MNLQEIDKWLDEEFGVSYTRLEELHDFVLEQGMKKEENLKKQLEAYENMRKEAIEYAKNSIDLLKPPCVSIINEEEYAPYIIIHDNYLNILNKVGEDNE